MDPTLVALIGTIMGGVGLKVAEHWLGKNKVKVDEATKIRDELRQELTALRAENRALEEEVDRWREDYWKLRESSMILKSLLQTNNINLPPPE